MQEILAYFFIYAFLGWIAEIIYQQLKRGEFVNRGMLAGPYCPIYGFGSVLLLFFLEPVKDNFLWLFLGSAILCSLLEFLIGFLFDKILHERWWDYSQEPMNIGGYICLRFSIAWGLGGALIMKEIHPFVQKIVFYLPEKLLTIILLLSLSSMLIDAIVTFIHIFGLNRHMKELLRFQRNMKSFSDSMGKQISQGAAKTSNKVQMILDNPEFKNRVNTVQQKLNRTQKRLLRAYPNLKGTRSELQHKILQLWSDRSRGKNRDERSNRPEK